jgi:hypothetical protein
MRVDPLKSETGQLHDLHGKIPWFPDFRFPDSTNPSFSHIFPIFFPKIGGLIQGINGLV